MGFVELSHVSFAYAGGAAVLCDVSLRLTEGVTALVGPNGCGKSTLLKLICGELRPDTGSIRCSADSARIVTCAQGVEDLPEAVLDFARDDGRDALALRARLGILDLSILRWATLSPGERRRFQIGAAIHGEPDILLLDEPTNHVDADTGQLLIDTLQAFRGITLLISHDRSLIDALASQTVRLEKGRLRAVTGGYSQAREVWTHDERATQQQRAALAQQARKAELVLRQARKLQAATERGRSTRTRMKHAQDSDGRSMGQKNLAAWAEARASRSVRVQQKRFSDLQTELSSHRVEKQLGGKVFAHYEPCPRPVLASLEGATLRHGDLTVLREVSVSIDRRARIRIQGSNGAGKSSLLQALFAACSPRERVVLLPQELTQRQAQALRRDTLGLPREEKGRVLNVVAALGLDPDRLLSSPQPSPGEARKLLIAHGLGRSAWALLLDEPTHHLDLPSVERLEHALREYPGALVVVSHDPSFLAPELELTWTVAEQRVVTAYR